MDTEVRNATKTDNLKLSPSQELAIDAILSGKRDRQVAEIVGVTRQTVNEWRNKNLLFAEELARRRQEIFAETHKRLQILSEKAIDVLEANLECDNPKVAVQAAQLILKFAAVG
jgi:leucyl aminopeptidase